MGQVRAAAAVVTLVGVLTAAGCSASEPAPVTSPTAVVPTVSATPTPSQEDLDYAAAETSYRTFRAELTRVLFAGGSKGGATKKMRETATGEYLKEFDELVSAYYRTGSRDTGSPERTIYVHPGGYSPTEVLLLTCFDSRDTRTVDGTNGKRYQGEQRSTTTTVRLTDGAWKLARSTSKEVSSCG